MNAHHARALLCLASSPCLASPLAAQSSVANRYGGETYDSTGDNLLDTIRASRDARRKMLGKATYDALMNEAIANAFRAEIGRKRIDAGQASTTFTPSGDASVLDQPAADGADGAEKDAAVASNRAVLAQSGMEPRTDDLADGQAVAFALLYPLDADGRALNAAQPRWVRDRMRSDVTDNPDFQRLTDERKPREYENLALRAMTIVTSDREARDELREASVPTDDVVAGFRRESDAQFARHDVATEQDAAHRRSRRSRGSIALHTRRGRATARAPSRTPPRSRRRR